MKRPLARWPVASFQSHFLVRAEIGDEGDGSKRERVAMTPSEVLKALSQRHELWPGDAVGAASSQRSKVSSLLLEKLAQAVAEIERIDASGFPKPILMRCLERSAELCGKVGDGVNQAADLISATASIPSLNFIPLTTFGNWF